jgi:MFS family permease
MKDFATTFGLSTMSADAKSNISGWVTSVIVLGGLVGALTSAPFNDALGRRWTLMLNAII